MREALFMGQVAANVSHEMLNVLATIGQSAGLMEDLLALSRKEKIKTLGFGGGFKYSDKFKTTLEIIAQQVKRGLGISERLNSFAHAPDCLVKKGDVAATLELIIALTERMAKVRRMRFVLAPGSERPKCAVNSLRLMLALFDVMQVCLHMVTATPEMNITLRQAEGQAFCVFTGGSGFVDISQSLYDELVPLFSEHGQHGIGLAREAEGGLAVTFPAA